MLDRLLAAFFALLCLAAAGGLCWLMWLGAPPPVILGVFAFLFAFLLFACRACAIDVID